MTVTDWLNMSFGEPTPAVFIGKGKRAKIVTPEISAPLIKDRLAELVYRNGGQFKVSGWGMKQSGIGIYDSMGLDVSEAFDLVYFYGMITGFGLAGPGRQHVETQVRDVLKDIWRAKGWTEE